MVSFFVITSFIATIFFSIGILFGKFLLTYFKNPFHLLSLQIILSLVIILIVFLILWLSGVEVIGNITPINFCLIVISSIFVFLGFGTLYYGLNHGNVSVSGIVLSSRVIFSSIFAIIILKETYSVIIYGWIAVILIGVILISWQQNLALKDALKVSGTGWYILTIFFWAIANTIIRFLNNEVFFILIVVIRLFTMFFLLVITFPKLNNSFADGQPLHVTRQGLLFVLIYVMVFLIADTSFTYSLGESLTIPEAISTFQGAIVFLSVLILIRNPHLQNVLNEPLDRYTIVIRFVGVLIATLGTLGVILGSN
ncbi:MAG: EamA family transporter [Candidatus Hodarchaeales archaeon]|jgi:drug/metabolite transporter (DMT)-like permease